MISVNLCRYDRKSLLWTLLTFHLNTNTSSFVVHHIRPIERGLSVFCALDPRRSFDVDFLHAVGEESLEPKSHSIGFARSKQIDLDGLLDFDDFVI